MLQGHIRQYLKQYTIHITQYINTLFYVKYLYHLYFPILCVGVEWVGWWLWVCELPHRYGRLSAGGAVWLHWLQVTKSLPSWRVSRLITSRRHCVSRSCPVLFRVQKEHLAFAPLLPQEVDALSVKGVSYLGNKMDWLIKSAEVSVSVRKPAEESGNQEPSALQVVLNTGTTIPLIPGNKSRTAVNQQWLIVISGVCYGSFISLE